MLFLFLFFFINRTWDSINGSVTWRYACSRFKCLIWIWYFMASLSFVEKKTALKSISIKCFCYLRSCTCLELDIAICRRGGESKPRLYYFRATWNFPSHLWWLSTYIVLVHLTFWIQCRLREKIRKMWFGSGIHVAPPPLFHLSLLSPK